MYAWEIGQCEDVEPWGWIWDSTPPAWQDSIDCVAAPLLGILGPVCLRPCSPGLGKSLLPVAETWMSSDWGQTQEGMYGWGTHLTAQSAIDVSNSSATSLPSLFVSPGFWSASEVHSFLQHEESGSLLFVSHCIRVPSLASYPHACCIRVSQ